MNVEPVDWSKCERQARRLQARIVKATREGRWCKVKALQQQEEGLSDALPPRPVDEFVERGDQSWRTR